MSTTVAAPKKAPMARRPWLTRGAHYATVDRLLEAHTAVTLALDVKVTKCRFQSKRAQRYIRIQLFPSTFKYISALNDFNANA